MPSRSAEHTIAGYIYQFLKTLEQLLIAKHDNSEITAEGYIEDIDVVCSGETESIQCKYHATQSRYVLSSIYHPILEMLKHYKDNNEKGIRYQIYAHFHGEIPRKVDITKTEINRILCSEDTQLRALVTELKYITNEDIDGFLSKFTLQLGLSSEDLEKRVKQLLKLSFQSPADVEVEDLLFPNAFVLVSKLHSMKSIEDRKLTKKAFLDRLRAQKYGLFNSWLLAYKGRAKLLEEKMRKLKSLLNYNARKRAVMISDKSVNNFQTVVPDFISKFAQKYNWKKTHTYPSIFCLDCDDEAYKAIRLALYHKNIPYNDGIVAEQFVSTEFLRQPQIIKSTDSREFAIRILKFERATILKDYQLDDLFVAMPHDISGYCKDGVNVEDINLRDMSEIEYVLGLRSAI